MNSESFKKLENLFNQPAELEQKLREYVKAHRLSPIAQYAEVLEYVLTRNNHPTIDDIFGELSLEDPTLTRSRLYSILEIFTKTGAIQTICVDRDTVYYQCTTATHGHFVCTSCGGVKDVPLAVEQTKIAIAGVVESVSVIYKGLCGRCVGVYIN